MRGKDLFALILIFSGGFMVWAGITNKQPIAALQTFLQGGDMSTVPTIVPAVNTGGPATITPGPLTPPSKGPYNV